MVDLASVKARLGALWRRVMRLFNARFAQARGGEATPSSHQLGAQRVTVATAGDEPGRAVTFLVTAWSWTVALAGLAVALWALFAAVRFVADPASWPVDEARTDVRVERALAQLALPNEQTLDARRAQWNAGLAEVLDGQGEAAPSGTFPSVALAWLDAAPQILGPNAAAAMMAVEVGAPPPFPGDYGRRSARTLEAGTEAALAEQQSLARAKGPRPEVSLLSEAVERRFFAAGAAVQARGFSPAPQARGAHVRLTAGDGLRQSAVFYGALADLVAHACAHARRRVDAPLACIHPDMPRVIANSDRLALAALLTAFGAPPASGDQRSQTQVRTGAATLARLGLEGVGALPPRLQRRLLRDVQFAVNELALLLAVGEALSALEARDASAGQVAEALTAAAVAAITAPATSAVDVLAPLGGMTEAASAETALHLLSDARDLGALQRRAAVVARTGALVALLDGEDAREIEMLAPRSLRIDPTFVGHLALCGAGFLATILVLLAGRVRWRFKKLQ